MRVNSVVPRSGHIGYDGNGNYFDGNLDSIHIYDTGEQIWQKEAHELYLKFEHKGPTPQGALWRIVLDENGDLAKLA